MRRLYGNVVRFERAWMVEYLKEHVHEPILLFRSGNYFHVLACSLNDDSIEWRTYRILRENHDANHFDSFFKFDDDCEEVFDVICRNPSLKQEIEYMCGASVVGVGRNAIWKFRTIGDVLENVNYTELRILNDELYSAAKAMDFQIRAKECAV